MKIYKINPLRFDRLQEFFKLGILSENIWLAGGALQTLIDPNIEINDYDLFFRGKGAANWAEEHLKRNGFQEIFRCPAGELITFKKDNMKVQLILKRYYANMQVLIDSFDFCSAMFAYNGRTLVTTKQAIKDTKKKHITINQITYPVATLNRMGKYRHQKGYWIPLETWLEVITVLRETEFDPDHLMLYVD